MCAGCGDDVYQLQLNTGQTLVSDAGRDLNVVPVWLQGITGCNSYVAIVDDGEPRSGGVVRGRGGVVRGRGGEECNVLTL